MLVTSKRQGRVIAGTDEARHRNLGHNRRMTTTSFTAAIGFFSVDATAIKRKVPLKSEYSKECRPHLFVELNRARE